MSDKVDLSQLAIERSDRTAASSFRGGGRRFGSQILLPAVLFGGILALAGWASFDLLFPPIEVTVVPVHAAQTVDAGETLFNTAGWVEPRPTPIRVAALAPGVVEKLLVVEDEAVKAGQPVAELIKEDAELTRQRATAMVALKESELQQAAAQLVAARTRLEQPVHLEAPLREAEASLAKVATELENLPFATRRAEADLKFAKSDYEGKLASEGTVTGRQVDEAKSRLDSAEALLAELKRRRASLESEQRSLDKRCAALRTSLELLADEKEARDLSQAFVNSAQSRLDEANVALAEAELTLKRMTITAPVDGRILGLVTDPGTRLGAAMGLNMSHDGSTVVTMYRPDSLQVRVDVRFVDVPDVSLGQEVKISNQAIEEPVTGRVLFISSVADIQKNTLQVKVAVDDPPAVFKPEMLVDVAFLEPESPDGTPVEETLRLFLPQDVIHQDESSSFVWVADQSEGIVRKIGVTIGASTNSGLTDVRGGLTVASRIVSGSASALTDGCRIRVTGEAPPQATSTNAKPDSSKPVNRLPAGESHP